MADQDGIQAVMIAAAHGHVHVLRLLVDAGADLQDVDQVFRTRACCACCPCRNQHHASSIVSVAGWALCPAARHRSTTMAHSATDS
jgi:ankyrin repeat protein